MQLPLKEWQNQMKSIVQQMREQVPLQEGHVLVVGCSTSEVAGQRIGTAGTMEVAQLIFDELLTFAHEEKMALAFQCCEHLNRAVVVDRDTAIKKGWEEVSVVPVRHAGGAMATYAFGQMENPTIVESIKADAGIDIGDTMIGMHLKPVAVPIRIQQRQLGEAHINIAKTRPKLIGGPRAVYE